MPEQEPDIIFTEDDTTIVVSPHNDALVITLQIGDYDVRRVLIDPRSSTKILYLDLLQKIGKTRCDLFPESSPLKGFGNDSVWPLGHISLPVQAGPVMLNTKFLVVDVPSPYNAIMGRPWLHKMKAIPSTYHQLLKFPFEGRIEEIRGDQESS